MDSKLTIAYAGTLMGYQPGDEKNSLWQTLKEYCWEYFPKTCYHYTRSGYFLFKGLELLLTKYPDLSNKLQVEMWGSIRSLNTLQVEQMGLQGIVQISGRLSKSETTEKLQQADILFLPLESSLNGQPPLFIPGKLFEYLELRKPILAVMKESEVSEILIKSGLGIIVSPFKTEEIADAIKELIENKGRLNKIYVSNEALIHSFSFDATADEFSKIFDDLIFNRDE